MRLFPILLIGVIAGGCLSAADDPFVGKWVWNSKKSPLPKITFKIKDLGGNRYSFTGSTNETTEFTADGVMRPSPGGGESSLKKISDREWLEIRKPGQFTRTLTVSPDDKTLTLTDTYTNPDGTADKSEFAYARTSPGKGFIGEWQSVKAKRLASGTGNDFSIERYGKDGLSFIYPSDLSRLDLNFDGKPYAPAGQRIRKGLTTRGTRVNAHLLRSEDWADGKLLERDEYSLSEDGKTLTTVSRPADSPAVFTNVFDKH